MGCLVSGIQNDNQMIMVIYIMMAALLMAGKTHTSVLQYLYGWTVLKHILGKLCCTCYGYEETWSADTQVREKLYEPCQASCALTASLA